MAVGSSRVSAANGRTGDVEAVPINKTNIGA